jgi:hypothetical protein
MSTQQEAVDSAQVLRDYDNFLAEECMIEEIMGSLYDQRETRDYITYSMVRLSRS